MRSQIFFPKWQRLDLFKSEIWALYIPGQLSNLELKLTNFHAVFLTNFQYKLDFIFGSEYCYNHILTPFNTPSGNKHHKMIKIDLKWTLGKPGSNLNVEAASRHDWSFNRSCPSVGGGLFGKVTSLFGSFTWPIITAFFTNTVR